MKIKQSAAINKTASTLRRKQTTPRTILDGDAQKKNASLYMGAKAAQIANGTKNAKNIDVNPNAPRSLVESAYAASYN